VAFNPYHEWLGLDKTVTKPSYYQLLGLNDFESDPHVIARAADSAKSRVRACKPGEHAALWAKLIDQIKQVKAYLLDDNRRTAYDQKLRGKISTAPAGAGDASSMYPPGMGGNNSTQVDEADEVESLAVAPVAQMAPATTDNPVPSAMAIPLPASQEQATSPAAPTQTMLAVGRVPVLEPATPQPQATAPTLPQAASPLALPLPQSATSDPMAPVPMNPAVATPQLPAGVPGPSTIDPMAPVAIDPMAPAPVMNPMTPAMPVPMAMATGVAQNFGAVAPMGMPQQNAVGGFPGAPVQEFPTHGEQAVDQSAPVYGSPSPALMAKKSRKRGAQQMVMMGMGLLVFGIFAGGVYYVVQNITNNEVASVDPPPNPNPDPLSPPNIPGTTDPLTNPGQPPDAPEKITTPIPMPEPAPEPEPMPAPMPVTPIPTPEPTPPPPPVVKPPREEVEALAGALVAAKNSLADKNFEAAKRELEKAEPLAKLPEHKAKLNRLQQINDNIVAFWNAVEAAAEKLSGGEVLKYRDSEIVIVESSREMVIFKASGQSIRRPARQLPDGVAIVFIDLVLPKDDAMTKIIKGSFYAVNVGKNPDHAQTARQIWQEAGLEGAEVEGLMLFLDDDYDLLKDLD